MFHFFQIILKNNLYNKILQKPILQNTTKKNFDFIKFNLNINNAPIIVVKVRYIGKL